MFWLLLGERLLQPTKYIHISVRKVRLSALCAIQLVKQRWSKKGEKCNLQNVPGKL